MIILSSGARALLEVISLRAINWISQYTSRSKAIKLISVLINVGWQWPPVATLIEEKPIPAGIY